MKMTLPLSLGATAALCLAYLHLVPAPQGECSTSSAHGTLSATATADGKTTCCSQGGACCREGAACLKEGLACCQDGSCCFAGAASSEPAKCCSAGNPCTAGSACCAATGCDCPSLVSMPTACEQSTREALIIAGDLARFVDQEISTVLPSVRSEGEILQMNFLEMTDGLGTLPQALQPRDGIVPHPRTEHK
jgi:hypothetical protein